MLEHIIDINLQDGVSVDVSLQIPEGKADRHNDQRYHDPQSGGHGNTLSYLGIPRFDEEEEKKNEASSSETDVLDELIRELREKSGGRTRSRGGGKGKKERRRRVGEREDRKGKWRKKCMAMELETPGSLPGLGGDRAHQSASPRTLSVSPSNR